MSLGKACIDTFYYIDTIKKTLVRFFVQNHTAMQQPKTVRIALRAMEPADIDAIYSWENDPSLWGVSAAHQPFSRQALQRFIDE